MRIERDEVALAALAGVTGAFTFARRGALAFGAPGTPASPAPLEEQLDRHRDQPGQPATEAGAESAPQRSHEQQRADEGRGDAVAQEDLQAPGHFGGQGKPGSNMPIMNHGMHETQRP